MKDIKKLDKLLDNKTKKIALVAPSFVVDFKYPNFIYQLKHLGFNKVVELTFGAKLINKKYYDILKLDRSKTWISSPCPTIVQLIRTKFPHLIPNLIPVHSPMGAMSRVCKKYFPQYRQVFIGPCFTKKFEAQEIGGIDLVLTFKEIKEYIDKKKPSDAPLGKFVFDKFYNDYTKIYPLSGGLSQTLKYKNILEYEQILVSEGISNLINIFSEFKNGKYQNYIFMDVLSCEGGCIGGPGIVSMEKTNEKVKKVIKYKEWAIKHEKDMGRSGKMIHAKGVRLLRKFS